MNLSCPASISCALAVAILPSTAWGQSQEQRVEDAEAAYDEGVQLYQDGQYVEAGRAFEQADALLPARVAMENAIRAYREGGDERRAATVATALVERDVSARGQARFVPRVAERSFKVVVSCDAPCTISVDGEETRYRTFFFAPNEPHFFRATFDTGVRETASTGDAGEVRDLVLEAPEPDELDGEGPPDRGEGDGVDRGGDLDDDDGGIDVVPLWATLTVAAVTAGLVGVAVWSGIDTTNARADFDAAPSLEKLEAGQSKEVRTNVLIAVSIGMAAVTGALFVFTDWGGGDEDDAEDASIRFGVGPMDGGAIASISGRIP